jgi:hypothetical protein
LRQLTVWAGVVRDGGLTVGTGPACSSLEANWRREEEAVRAMDWAARRDKLGKLVKGALKKGEGKERANMGDKAEGLCK